MHGGRSLGGADSPTFKHGLYSRYMPRGLRENYEKVLADGDLTQLNDELGLLTVRMAELLARLEDGAPSWEQVLVKWGEVAQSVDVESSEPLQELRTLICEGVAASVKEQEIWEELRELIRDKTKTASAEWSRLRDLQGLVRLDQIMVMWRGVLEAIKHNVTDPVMLKALTADVLRCMPAPSAGLEVLEADCAEKPR